MKKLFLFVFLLSISSVFANKSKWEFQIEPYLMLTNIDGKASLGKSGGLDLKVDFDDILENLDVGFMGHFEAINNSKWGFLLDYAFMDLKHDGQGPFNNSVLSASIKQGVLEGAAFYRKSVFEKSFLDTYLGVRWWNNEVSLTREGAVSGQTVSKSGKKSWVDPVIGLRFFHNFHKDWTFLAKGDIGGLSIGSKFTSLLGAGAIYNISDLLSLDLQYKALWVNYEDGNEGDDEYFKYDTVTHGLTTGLIFKF